MSALAEALTEEEGEIPEREAEPLIFRMTGTRGVRKVPAMVNDQPGLGGVVALSGTPGVWRYDGNCSCRQCAGRPKRVVA